MFVDEIIDLPSIAVEMIGTTLEKFHASGKDKFSHTRTNNIRTEARFKS